MKKNNNSYINNATLEIINNSASIIANVFDGKITRNDTINSDATVKTDDELSKYHDSIYIARVDFSEEKHNAIEITATARAFYIAYGDSVNDDIINRLSLKESATATERKTKWNMKNKAVFNIDTFKDIMTKLQTESDSETATESDSETKKTRATATKKKTATKRQKKTA